MSCSLPRSREHANTTAPQTKVWGLLDRTGVTGPHSGTSSIDVLPRNHASNLRGPWGRLIEISQHKTPQRVGDANLGPPLSFFHPSSVYASHLPLGSVTSSNMGQHGTFQNIRVYCELLNPLGHPPSARNGLTCVYARAGLAFIVYWGIVLFGYDT